eukprot:163701-Chlamydomonas_euryale.AAC.1
MCTSACTHACPHPWLPLRARTMRICMPACLHECLLPVRHALAALRVAGARRTSDQHHALRMQHMAALKHGRVRASEQHGAHHVAAAMKLDVNVLRYLSKDDFRVLTAVEMGQKN